MSFDAGAVIGRMELSHREMGKALSQIKKDFNKFGTESTKEVGKTKKAFLSLKQAIAGLGLAYVGRQVAKFAAEVVKEFGVVERTTESVNIQLQKYGKTWTEVGAAMREATGGAVSDLELLKRSGQALTLGLKPDEFIEMSRIARAAARAMGEDTSKMLESIVTGTARQSKLWLDNLGIIIDTEQAYKRYADAVGKSVKQLSEQERKQAFTNAVLERGREMVAELGDDTTKTAISIERAAAAWENMRVSIGRILATDGVLADTLNFWVSRFSELTEYLETISQVRQDTSSSRELAALGDELVSVNKEIKHLEMLIEHKKAGRIKGFLGRVDKDTTKEEERLNEAYARRLVFLARIKGLQSEIKEKNRIQADLESGNLEDPTRPQATDQDKQKAAEQYEWLQDQFRTREEMAQKHYDEMIRTMQQGELTKDELRQGEILAEQYKNQQLEIIRNEREQAEAEHMDRVIEMSDKVFEHARKAMEEEQTAIKKRNDAYKKSATLGVKLLINDVKAQSKILAGFEIAEGTAAFARFLKTKDATYLLESLQHALAAKQYMEAAKSGGGGGGSGGGGGGGGRGREREQEGLRESEMDKRAAAAFEVHFHGGFASEEAVTEWTVNTFAPVVEKAVNSGKMELKTKRE